MAFIIYLANYNGFILSTPSEMKILLQDLLHKNSFYSVKEFNEYFQNKDEAKPTTEICIILYYNMYYFHFTLQEPC